MGSKKDSETGGSVLSALPLFFFFWFTHSRHYERSNVENGVDSQIL